MNLLEKEVKKEANENLGNVMQVVMGAILSIILIVAVAIPITTQAITAANLTGMNQTIVNFIPTFLALAGLVVVAGVIYFYGGA